MSTMTRRGFLAATGSAAAVLMSSAGRPLSAAALGFTTIQAALDAAAPGDVIEIPAGHYHENIVVNVSGTAAAPITLRAAPGAHVVIDGADPQLQTANTRWAIAVPATDTDPAVWRATVGFDGDDLAYAISSWVSRTDVSGSHGCDQLVAAYASLATLASGRPRGEGSFRDGEDVYLVLDDGADPNDVGLSIGTASAVINLNGHSHLRITDIEIRNGGWAGIYMPGPQELDPDDPLSGPTDDRHVDIEITDVTIRNCFRSISAGQAENLRITRARLVDGVDQDWPWGGAYDAGVGRHPDTTSDILAPWRGYGVQLTRVVGAEVSDCVIAGQWDGIGLKRCTDVDIHHCTIFDTMDDAIELESPEQSLIRFHSNHLWNVFAGISFTVNYPGPIHVYRNVVESTHPGGRGYSPSYALKSGHDSGTARAENIKFYNNTLISPTTYNLWEKKDDEAPDGWTGYDFVNNIFWSGTTIEGRGNYNFRGRGAEDDGGTNHWESNVYNLSEPVGQAPLAWSDSELTNRVAPWQAHYNDPPTFVSLVGTAALPATGGASAGDGVIVASPELAELVERARTAGVATITLILREDTLQPSTISFASKDDTALSGPMLTLGYGSGPDETEALTPVADTYVWNDQPDADVGAESRIHVRHTASADFRRIAYLRFDIAAIDGPVVDATLALTIGTISSGRVASTLQLYAVDPAFVPGSSESGAATIPDLETHFVGFSVPDTDTPRDLHLVGSSSLIGSASAYPLTQAWPDDVELNGLQATPGAWQPGATDQRIGADPAMLAEEPEGA